MGFVLRLTPEEAPLRGSLSRLGGKTYTHRTWSREQCEPKVTPGLKRVPTAKPEDRKAGEPG